MQADSIWLTETSRISGEIHYKSLQMDRGAALNCRVVHNWNEVESNVENDTSELDKGSDAEVKAVKK